MEHPDQQHSAAAAEVGEDAATIKLASKHHPSGESCQPQPPTAPSILCDLLEQTFLPLIGTINLSTPPLYKDDGSMSSQCNMEQQLERSWKKKDGPCLVL
ncbi:unnamed protein product [Pleuronectes platessa]|uniref:Uncharacterized protein n=1 Tax=Pleuronectes platessa TaxID=8262 RepID=A0A9N7YDL9_PLEPL|nr:unnamed protein product [Pleuronectes platessa]